MLCKLNKLDYCHFQFRNSQVRNRSKGFYFDYLVKLSNDINNYLTFLNLNLINCISCSVINALKGPTQMFLKIYKIYIYFKREDILVAKDMKVTEKSNLRGGGENIIFTI